MDTGARSRKKTKQKVETFYLKKVARDGFEPPQTEPKSAVLPLDDRAIFHLKNSNRRSDLDCKGRNALAFSQRLFKNNYIIAFKHS